MKEKELEKPTENGRRKALKMIYTAPAMIALGTMIRPTTAQASVIPPPPPPPSSNESSAQEIWNGK